MCGIGAILGTQPIVQLPSDWNTQTSSAESNDEIFHLQSAALSEALRPRGPDSQCSIDIVTTSETKLHLSASVLAIRGEICPQPIRDEETGNILCWNGEVYDGQLSIPIKDNDTEILLNQLCRKDADVNHILTSIEGEWSILFWEHPAQTLWAGRSLFGQRSLLLHLPNATCPSLSISSIAFGDAKSRVQSSTPSNNEEEDDGEEIRENWEEMSPEYLYRFVFEEKEKIIVKRHAWHKGSSRPEIPIVSNEEEGNREEESVKGLLEALSRAVRSRVINLPNPSQSKGEDSSTGSKLGILFSGGIDSMVLAALSDLHVDPTESIDLLNVSFSVNGNYNVPDRVTGRNGVRELRTLSNRTWNFIEIDVGPEEFSLYRDHILDLIYPKSSIMDVTIGAALWFASKRYNGSCQAKVLLDGLGADEQLAGYGRHRVTFKKGGKMELRRELDKDIHRLWQRNLGRDDRLISDHGREARFPFLDEGVVRYISSLPLNVICDFDCPPGVGDKKILRQLADRIGLKEASTLTKRAIQTSKYKRFKFEPAVSYLHSPQAGNFLDMEKVYTRSHARDRNSAEPQHHSKRNRPTNNNTRTTNSSTNTMRHAITLLFLALSATAVWANICQPGYVWCSGVNTCYDPSQYSCNADQYHGQYRLCATGTASCNDVCIASCAYQCGTDGSYTARTDRSCSSPPSCVTNNMMACGDACYDSSKFCCVSGQPQDISTCPQPTAAVADTTCKSPFGLYNVRSLLGGQLRINAAKSITAAVNFTLSAGSLFDHKGQQCYISTGGQLMYGAPITNAVNGAVNGVVNTVANTANGAIKTIFGISGDYLSHNGSLLWYACSSPSGGSNLYVNKVNGLTCSANYLYATLTGPTVPSALSNVIGSVLPVTNVVSAVLPVTNVVTSILPITNILGGLFGGGNKAPSTSAATSNFPPPTTYTPATSSIPIVSPPCVPGGPSIPVPYCYYSFDNGILGNLLKDDSGNGKIATVLGLPSVILGKTKQALGFGSSAGFQGLRLDQTAGLDGAFSIATWLKVQASNKVMKIVSAKKGLFSLLSGWELSINPVAKTCTFTSGFSSVSWNINIPTDTWFHLAFTAEKSGKVILYINGIAGATQNIALSKVISPLYIAADQSISNFKGALDDFLMFTQSLSAQQILSIISNRCSTSTSAPATSSQSSTPAQSFTLVPSDAPYISATDTGMNTQPYTPTPSSDAGMNTQPYTPTDAVTSPPATDAGTSQIYTPTSTPSTSAAQSSNPSFTGVPASTAAGMSCGLPWLYWSFDKINQGRCTDDSGHGRHGAFSTDISLVVGKLRRGCNWKSGNRLYITLPQFNLNNAFTIATWLRLDAIGGKNIIASTKALLSGWELAYDGSAKQITFQPSQGSYVSWDASSLQVGAWAHVAVAVSAGRAELFLNGVSCGVKSISALVQSVVGLTVGGKLSADPLRGTLDEFLVFDRTLVKQQICDARDKYLTGAIVPANNWSQQTGSYDWGTGWELGSVLSSVSLNRMQNWWIF
ncbi:hypothetical protein PROFUN_13240 [Planoprotostelium fungivorum]|uniref:Glutamine amidotransferase type-2 domain-containing protein n=1 Tax=Planoprotostelium fungivorum TaxID=1890364 RepID=A0A2P6N4R8_9EUKA|nr:hypothetical protein PROFUN_13240 [Planoprotostelium fungivorum]